MIAVLVNPRSGKHKATNIGADLSGWLNEKNTPHTVFTDHWPEDFEGFTEIWLVGGDGTINYFLNAYPANILPLALYKGGTGNDFAWKLYGNRSVRQQFDHILTAKAQPVDVAMCNDRYYANSCGIGFDGEVLRSINTIRWLGGHLGYLWVVIRKIFSFKEYAYRVNGAASQKFLLVIANNSSRTGGGFMVTPKARTDDGLVDIMLCRPLPVLSRLFNLPKIEKGKHLDLPFISYSQEEGITIEAEKELYAQLDGELYQARLFSIKVVPGKLMMKY